jgi:hypothetical protein
MNRDELVARLHRILSDSHEKFGQDLGPLCPGADMSDLEIHPVGRTGAIAFVGDYVLVGWEDHDMRRASRDAWRCLYERLQKRGFTRHVVYPMNFRSVIQTRKLGAVPQGVDADGYVHYLLTLDAFLQAPAARHCRGHSNGQEVAASQGA